MRKILLIIAALLPFIALASEANANPHHGGGRHHHHRHHHGHPHH